MVEPEQTNILFVLYPDEFGGIETKKIVYFWPTTILFLVNFDIDFLVLVTEVKFHVILVLLNSPTFIFMKKYFYFCSIVCNDSLQQTFNVCSFEVVNQLYFNLYQKKNIDCIVPNTIVSIHFNKYTWTNSCSDALIFFMLIHQIIHWVSKGNA